MRNIQSLIMALFLAPVPFVQAQEVSDRDKFELWNNCAEIRLFVGDLKTEAAEFNLRKEDIETAVRSRLRGARIYTENWFDDNGSWIPSLSINVNNVNNVNVNTVGFAFNIRVDLTKRVLDPASGQFGRAVTWQTGATGTHRNDAIFVISGVSKYTDEFIDEYLRVNAAACK